MVNINYSAEKLLFGKRIMSDKKKLIIAISIICVLSTWFDMFIFDFGADRPSRGSMYIGFIAPLVFIIIILMSSRFTNTFKRIDIPSDCKSKSTIITLLICVVISLYPCIIILSTRHGFGIQVPKIFEDFSRFLRNFLEMD